MATVTAIYENGVFRPLEETDVPERCQVQFEPRIVGPPPAGDGDMAAVYEILSRRYNSGTTDTAKGHHES